MLQIEIGYDALTVALFGILVAAIIRMSVTLSSIDSKLDAQNSTLDAKLSTTNNTLDRIEQDLRDLTREYYSRGSASRPQSSSRSDLPSDSTTGTSDKGETRDPLEEDVVDFIAEIQEPLKSNSIESFQERRDLARGVLQLPDHGINSIRDLAQADPTTVADVTGVSEDIAEEWVGRAKQTETASHLGPADQLEAIEGIGPTYADRLRSAGFDSIESLAEADAKDVAEVANVSQETAEKWIETVQNYT